MVQLRYLQRFIDAYQGKRTFAFQWSQDMSHDYLNLIGSADGDYEEFFRKNQENFDDTIVIFFSDHDYRTCQ
uniref:Sulfatase domain-containing protein n=1 Tax=Steinernema glaseri TaxID=37863 RepID=A0A1I7ZAI3_9BILA